VKAHYGFEQIECDLADARVRRRVECRQQGFDV
jgi:hypothetical protein